MRTSLFCLLLLVLVGACQSVPEGGSADRAQPTLITQAELDDLPVITARQAIERLRPRWLRARISTLRSGAGIRHTATVFVDGMPRGGLDTLEGIETREIAEIRFLSASDATTRYGTGYPRGIIEVSTRRGL
jgi:hypothetical protein